MHSKYFEAFQRLMGKVKTAKDSGCYETFEWITQSKRIIRFKNCRQQINDITE